MAIVRAATIKTAQLVKPSCQLYLGILIVKHCIISHIVKARKVRTIDLVIVISNLAKSSLILGENKAGFRRESHNYCKAPGE